MITVVDYGVGNTGALLNMFDYLGVEAELTGIPDRIVHAHALILPGVGAFDKAMTTLRERRLVEALNEAVLNRKVPVLGVCLGMQLLARRSEEGVEHGLGWLEADVLRITPPLASGLKVPNMGWLHTKSSRKSPLFDTTNVETRFYFDHSYHMVCDDPDDVVATINYGTKLCCAVSRGHIAGVQFHPEKSHRHGMRLLAAFAALGQI